MRRVARCQGCHERGRHLEADCPHSKRVLFGMHYWPECLRGQAATYRKLAEQTDDPVVKKNLLALMSVCEELADSIDDHLSGG